MKTIPPDKRQGTAALRLALALCAIAVVPFLVYASAPSWWSQREVLIQNATPSDFAPANQGQLKNIAKAAAAEMDARLPGGAGAIVHALIASWSPPNSQTNDRAPVNIGQLKKVAKPFYDRLIATTYASNYPWVNAPNPPKDFAAASIGQVKNLFSFDFRAVDATHDTDQNALADWWERFYFGSIGNNPNALALRGGGVTILQAFQQVLNPNDFYDGVLPLLQKTNGDAQTGKTNEILIQPLRVRITDSGGAPVANAPVTFSGSASGATLAAFAGGPFGASFTANADQNGIASASVRLPGTTGTVNIVATVTSGSNTQSVTFTATATTPVDQTAPPPYEVLVLPANAPPYIVTFESNSVGLVAGSGTDQLSSEAGSPPRRSFLWNPVSGTYTELGFVPGSSSTEALALNNAGDVVGDATDANGNDQGFLWRNGTIEPIVAPGAAYTYPYAINDAGQVVGTTYDANWVSRGFVWNNGVFTLIEVPNSNGTTVEDINAAGQVLGSYYDENWNSQAFIWQNGVITPISIPGAMSVSQHFLNDSGQVAGVYRGQNYWDYGFFWQNGVATTITLGGFRTSVYGLNATGQVIGSSVPAGKTVDRGFVWQNGQITQLGSLAEGQSYDYSVGQSINFYGAIVGTSATPQGSSTSVLWQDGHLWKLTDCVPAYLHPDGAYFEIGNSYDITGRRLVLHRLPDSDGDGLPDAWETQYGLDPNSAADASADADGDGLTNYQEYQAGTNPLSADTDGDAMPDGWEVAHGYDPRDAVDAQLDEDNDGLTTVQEYQNGTEPRGVFTVTDVATSNSVWVFPSGLNAGGQVIGTRGDSAGNTRGFFWHDGVVEDLTPPGAGNIDLYSFNDLGQTVGRYLDGNDVLHVFLWQNGAATDLPFPPLYSSAAFVRPQINNQGQIMGTSVDANSRPQSFIWRDGAVVETASGFAWSYGLGLNNPGLLVGAAFDADWTGHGFIWQDGSLNSLPQVPDRGAINDAGVAAIQYHDSITQIQRVATVENGSINPLGTGYVGELVLGRAINAAGHVLVRNGSNPGVWSNGQLAMVTALNGLWVWPQAFNDSDAVVGESTTPSGATHAFIARHNHTTDLNYLVPQGSGLEFSSAIAVNNNEQILVKAYKDGWNHAVLLTPNNDADLNGLPDDWEKFYFGHLGVDPTADADGDGITNAQEYANRTNPNDYYNGVAPVLSIVSGNNQQSSAGTFTLLPLVVKLADAAGNALVNAPVTFTVSDGGGGLAETPEGTPALTQGARTAADGRAAVFYLQPVAANVTSHITASAGSPGSSTTVVFMTESTDPITGTAPRLWLKADAGITKDASSRVSSWADQSGANNNTTQATSSNQPLWVDNSLNGKPVVRFDGADDQLVAASAAGSDNFTVIAVAKTANTHEIDGESNSGTSGTGGQRYLFGATYPNGAGVSMGTNGISVYEHAGSYMPALAVYQGALGTGYNIVTVKYTGRRPQIYLNSALVRTGFQSALSTVIAPTQIGSGPYGAFGGDIAEVLIYNRALSDSDRALVENDLNQRYNVVTTAPGAPSNLTASAATSTQVTLSWNSPGPFLVKLERKAGANGTYAQVGVTTATGVTIYSDSGLSASTTYYYRVRAFNLFGDSPYSNEFAITTPDAGPSVPSNGMKVWLRGDFGVNKDAANMISVWADASGNGNDAVQTTAANRPVAVQGALNGRPLVHFDGTDDILTLPNFGSTFTEGEVFVVLRSTGTHVDVSTLWTMGDDYIWGPNLYPNSDGGVYETFGTRNQKATGQPPQALNQYHVYNVSSKANEFVTRFNGAEFYRTASNTVFFPAAPTLGGGIYSRHRFGGDIAEMVIYDHVLTQTERDAVTAYCQVKYGLVDSDGDGLADWKEVEIGTQTLNPDTDGDGIPDGWEFNHGLNPLANDSAADPDGDGYTNLQEYQNNTDPFDFFNGAVFNLNVSSGNGQSASPGAWLSQPLSVLVTNGVGAPLANAPVTFSVTASGGALSATSGGTETSTLSGRTNAAGVATVFFKAPATARLAIVTAQAGISGSVKQVSFTASTTDATFPFIGLNVWLSADNGITKDGSNKISSWVDGTGNGNNAVQNSAGSQPVLIESALNGEPVVHFDGSSSFFSLPNFGNGFAQGEVFVVLKTGAHADANTLWLMGDDYIWGPQVYPNADGTIQETFGTRNLKMMGKPSQALDQFHLYNVSSKAGEFVSRINGREHYRTNSNTVFFPGNPMLGGGAYGAHRFGGDVAEVLIFNRVLTEPERIEVGAYLNQKYAYVGAVPEVPTQLETLALGPTQVSVSWANPISNAITFYDVQRRVGNGAWATIASVSNGMSYIDSSTTALTGYGYRIVARNDAGSAAPTAEVTVTTPASGGAVPLTDIKLWLKADEGVSRDTATVWTDSSGNNNDAIQVTAAYQPQVIENAINGKPVVHFNGSNNAFGLPNFASGFTQGEVFVVLKTGAHADANTLWLMGDDYIWGPQVYPNPDGTIQETFGTRNLKMTGKPSQALDQFHLYNVSSKANEFVSRINGRQHYRTTSNSVFFPANSLLGGGAYSLHRFGGDIAEVIIFNRVLNDQERGAVELYLNEKFRYVANPPPVPTNVEILPLSPGQVSVSWINPVSNVVTYYDVQRRLGNGDWETIATVTNGMSYIDSSLAGSTQYSYRIVARNASGSADASSEVTVTTPASGAPLPTADIKVWLKADEGVATNHPTFWTDSSGNHNDAIQVTADYQPQLIDNALNGKPVVHFDGVNDAFSLPNFGNGLTQGEVFVVLKTGPHVDVNTLWMMGDDYIWGPEVYPNPDGTIQETFGTRNLKQTGRPSQPLNQFHLYDVSSRTGEFVSRINGREHYRTNSNTVFFPSNPILGGGAYGAHRFGGDIAEILIFNRVLTEPERQSVGAYLNLKYRYVPDAPTAPTQIEGFSLGPTQVSLSWVSPIRNEITFYDVQRQLAGGPWQTIGTVTNGMTYIDNSATAATQYNYRVVARNNAGSSDPSAEISLTTSLSGAVMPVDDVQLWFKADEGVARDHANVWTDSSGHVYDAVQTTADYQPQVIENAINGKPAVRFDGTNDFFPLPNFTSGYTQGEVFVVLKSGPHTDVSTLWLMGDDYIWGPSQYPSGDGSILETFGTRTIKNVGVPAAPLTQFNLYNVSSKTNEFVVRLNGIDQYATNNNTVFFPDNLALGAGAYGLHRFGGDIAEMLVFNRVLTQPERERVQAYLGSKYLLPGYDLDGDGLTNAEELALGTDPRKFDTNGDGISDGMAVRLGINPLGPGYLWPPSPNPPSTVPLDFVLTDPPGVTLIQP